MQVTTNKLNMYFENTFLLLLICNFDASLQTVTFGVTSIGDNTNIVYNFMLSSVEDICQHTLKNVHCLKYGAAEFREFNAIEILPENFVHNIVVCKVEFKEIFLLYSSPSIQNVLKKVFRYEFKNFSSLGTGKMIESDPFNLGDNLFCIGIKKYKTKKTLGLFLVVKYLKQMSILTQCTISLYSCNHKNQGKKAFKHKFTKDLEENDWGYSEFVAINDVLDP